MIGKFEIDENDEKGKCENLQKHFCKNFAQAAIEFLITYGWVLFVLAIIMAFLLFYTSSTINFFPEKCLFPKSIICNNFILYKNETHEGIKVNITNNMGYKINITKIVFSYETGRIILPNLGILEDGGSLLISKEGKIAVNPLNFSKDFLTIKIEITYNPCLNSICENTEFNINGMLMGKVNRQ